MDAVEGFSDEMMHTINEAAKRYCLALIEMLKKEGEDFSYKEFGMPYVTDEMPADEMPRYFEISEISADEPETEDQLYFRLTGGCDWEIEHGFEAAFCDGKLIYLGSYEQATPRQVGYYITGKGRAFNYAIND